MDNLVYISKPVWDCLDDAWQRQYKDDNAGNKEETEDLIKKYTEELTESLYVISDG